MAPRKSTASLPVVSALSARKSRDDRARRRDAVRDPGLHDRITQLNAINSSLLRLPAELRNQIFTYVFSCEEYRFLGNERRPITCRISSFQHNGLGPLLVSRPLYIETAILPYKLGTFRSMFDDSYSEKEWSWYVKRFLENRSTAQIKAISSLQATEITWRGPQ